MALAVAAVAILIYISLAFRRLPNPVLYGAAAIVALLHDITLVAGAFAIGGQIAGLEVNAMFITALLAIIGYSVNDTIVVFDRIRENLLLDPREDFRRVVNAAITQSLGRSLNTSITVVLALMALLLIGGVTVRPFVIVLLIGTVGGHVFLDCGGVAAIGAVAGRHAATAVAVGRGATGGSVGAAEDMRGARASFLARRASFLSPSVIPAEAGIQACSGDTQARNMFDAAPTPACEAVGSSSR